MHILIIYNQISKSYYYLPSPYHLTISYPMTQHPILGYATITVNSFNTSLPAGQILANFTANTTNGNTITFTISSLAPSKSYTIKNISSKRVAILLWPCRQIPQAKSRSIILNGLRGTFTVEEVPPPTGSIAGKIIYVNQTPATWRHCFTVLPGWDTLWHDRVIRRWWQIPVQ